MTLLYNSGHRHNSSLQSSIFGSWLVQSFIVGSYRALRTHFSAVEKMFFSFKAFVSLKNIYQIMVFDYIKTVCTCCSGLMCQNKGGLLWY